MTSGQRHRRLPADLINQHKRTGGAALSAALEVVSGGRPLVDGGPDLFTRLLSEPLVAPAA